MLRLQTLLIGFLNAGLMTSTPSLRTSCTISGQPATLSCQFNFSISNLRVLIKRNDDDTDVADCDMGNSGKQANCSDKMFKYKSSNSTMLVLEALANRNYTGNYSCVLTPEENYEIQYCAYTEEDLQTTQAADTTNCTVHSVKEHALAQVICSFPSDFQLTETVNLVVKHNKTSTSNVETVLLLNCSLKDHGPQCEGKESFVVSASSGYNTTTKTASLSFYASSDREGEYFCQTVPSTASQSCFFNLTDDVNDTENRPREEEHWGRALLSPKNIIIIGIGIIFCIIITVICLCVRCKSNKRNATMEENSQQPLITHNSSEIKTPTESNNSNSIPGGDLNLSQETRYGEEEEHCQQSKQEDSPLTCHFADETLQPPGDKPDPSQQEIREKQNLITDSDLFTNNENVDTTGPRATAAPRDRENFKVDQSDTSTDEIDWREKYECETHRDLWVIVEDWIINNVSLLECITLGKDEIENDNVLVKMKRLRADAQQYCSNVQDQGRNPGNSCKCNGLFGKNLKEIQKIEKDANEEVFSLERNRKVLIKHRTFLFVQPRMKATSQLEPYNLKAVDGIVKTCRAEIARFRSLETELDTELQEQLKKCLEWEYLIPKYLETIRQHRLDSPGKCIETVKKHIKDLEALKDDVIAQRKVLDDTIELNIESSSVKAVYESVKSHKTALQSNQNNKKKLFTHASESDKPELHMHELTRNFRDTDEGETENKESMYELTNAHPGANSTVSQIAPDRIPESHASNIKRNDPSLTLTREVSSSRRRHHSCQGCVQLPGKPCRVPGDGFCLLSAAAGALFLLPGFRLPSFKGSSENISFVKQKLTQEFSQNKEFYKQHFKTCTQSNLSSFEQEFENIEEEFQRYTERGEYDNDTCDHIIFILCNALAVRANIYLHCTKCDAYKKHFFNPTRVTEYEYASCINLLYNENHYDYIQVAVA